MNKRAAAFLLLVSSSVGAGCGPEAEIDAVEVALSMPLVLETGDRIEVTVFETARINCASVDAQGMIAVENDRVGRSIKVADALNQGPVTLSMDGLPATGPLGQIPLSFAGRVLRGTQTLADDCADGVVIPEGGRVTVNLQLAE